MLFGSALALALRSSADLCGARFPYFQEGRTALAGSGNANSSRSEKREGRFVQHGTYAIRAVKKGLGNRWLFSVLHIQLYDGIRMLNYSDVTVCCAEDIIRLKSL